MGAVRVVEWVDEPAQWLGQDVSALQQEIAIERAKLSTSEKILFVSLFLNVVGLAWTVYRSSLPR